MDKTSKIGPFHGILVIDLTHALNGPFATSMLSDLGARVIKVEAPPVGDETRYWGPFVNQKSLEYAFVNRGKESIVLDLKDDNDKDVFFNMIRKADVVVENFRPGTMDRLGLSYEKLSSINPRLIYASSSGFGQTGPMSHFPAYDTIIQAMSGLMMETGFPDGPPVKTGTSLCDLSTGLYLFSGIATALFSRERTGEGTCIDVSMLDAAIPFLEQGLMTYLATGSPPERVGNRDLYIAPFDTYKTADKYIVICCGNDHLFGKLCEVMNMPLQSDSRFFDNNSRVKNQDLLKKIIERILSKNNSDYWLKHINKAGVPVGPILNIAETMNLPQIRERNMLVDTEGILMPGMPLKFSNFSDPKVRKGAPTLNEQGEIIRNEFKQ